MKRTTNCGRPRSGVTVKNVKDKIIFVDGEFTVKDLKKEMDKRKVFGSYSLKHVYRLINKAQKCNLIKRVRKGASRNGEVDVFKKVN